MKERPILFSAQMVRAILEGRKTQTRRIVKPQPDLAVLKESARDLEFEFRIMPVLSPSHHTPAEWGFVQKYDKADCVPIFGYKCPYGQPGDRLWVRETWKPGAWRDDGRVAVDYRATPEETNTPWVYPTNFDDLWQKWTDEVMQAGSVPDENGFHHWCPGKSPMKWRPSIFMPRWASRITLEITGIWVEQLQKISRGDAMGEGCPFPNMVHVTDPREWFADSWRSINGPESWNTNPWVWVIEFKRGNQ